jgi:putative salt-induced outer membrane protein
MIREAHPRERKAIVDVAKRLYPASAERIDDMVRRIDKEAQASAARAGFFEAWKGEASLGGSYSKGNTDEWTVSAAFAARRKGLRWTHELEARIDLKEESGDRTEERAAGKYTLRRTLGSGLFGFGRLSFERDRLAGIDRRFFESIGLGYQLLERRTIRWDAMAGPALRQTRYAGGSSASEPALFARTKLEWDMTDRLRFSEEADAGLAQGNSTLSSTTALTSNLYGTLFGRISYGIRIETNPPPGRETTDMNTRVSLVYAF